MYRIYSNWGTLSNRGTQFLSKKINIFFQHGSHILSHVIKAFGWQKYFRMLNDLDSLVHNPSLWKEATPQNLVLVLDASIRINTVSVLHMVFQNFYLPKTPFTLSICGFFSDCFLWYLPPLNVNSPTDKNGIHSVTYADAVIDANADFQCEWTLNLTAQNLNILVKHTFYNQSLMGVNFFFYLDLCNKGKGRGKQHYKYNFTDLEVFIKY